ncbi:MAG: Gfo/Idh/MocA family oxidoreductase [Bacteroidales bacterium]|nr:Gfo/Idh/MocA family oxidoreductase [Bacteroidales bacterium]MBN2821004.1 Gfo/Idh/MocA family oxidoreductase [Bacteroidales bacterium]
MSTKIKWGIIATGGIANKFASDLRMVKNAELTAVASRSYDKAKIFAKQYNAKYAFGSYEELAKCKDVDVVYIATPHTFHYDNTILCMNNGKHVLCEKPVGMNSRQLESMIALARQKNLFFMEAFWTRFLPSYLKFRELATNGSIGDIKYIHADFGFVGSKDPMNRIQNKALGGGSLLDIGIYPVFLALDIAGLPENIVAQGILNKTGIDETFSALFNYTHAGIIANLSSTIVTKTPVEAIVYGTKGSVKLNREFHIPTSVVFTDSDGDHTNYKFKEKGFGYEYEAQEVTRCILEGKTESQIFPLEASLILHKTLDKIRQQIGLVYDADN